MITIPERRECAANGAAVSYLIEGGGPPLIMVHGLLSNAVDFYFQFREFSGRFTCIAPDVRGFGMSRVANPESVTIGQAADDLTAFIGAVLPNDEQPTLIGHSFGGMLCLETLARIPGRLRRLALIAAPTDVARKPLFGAAIPLFPLVVPFVNKFTIDFYTTKLNVRSSNMTPELRELIRLRDSFITEAGVRALGGYLRSMRKWRMPALPPRAREIPVFAATGSRDPMVGRGDLARLKRAFPNVRHHLIKNTGHSCMYEKPDVFNSLLTEFLDET